MALQKTHPQTYNKKCLFKSSFYAQQALQSTFFKWILRLILHPLLISFSLFFVAMVFSLPFSTLANFMVCAKFNKVFSFGFIVFIVKIVFYIKRQKRHTKDYCIFLNTPSLFINIKEKLSEFLCYLIRSND